MMDLAIKKARKTMKKNYGGPFGAVVVKDGEVISISSNTVLKDNDATAHAEINAIRNAGKKLKTFDLNGCEIYTTSFPCPMCLSAIIWSNIKKVYVGANTKDVENIGFRDGYIYKLINNDLIDKTILKIEEIDRDKCLALLKEYKDNNKNVY